jgi:hypothetical protein
MRDRLPRRVGREATFLLDQHPQLAALINLFDRVEKTTSIEPFGRLVEQVMSTEPYASARTVYWILDNGSSHAGKTSIKRTQSGGGTRG